MRDVAVGSVALLAALAASLSHPHARAPEPDIAPRWPCEFEGRVLWREPLSAREQRLGAGFGGSIARFSDGERQLVLRWLDGTPRGYHGAIDCYRGLGFAIAPLAISTDAAGHSWSNFEARRGDEVLWVRERVECVGLDDRAHSWTEPAAWFWDAALGRVDGPCLAWLVVERRASAQASTEARELAAAAQASPAER